MPILVPHWNGPVPKTQAEADALKQSLLDHAGMLSRGDIIIEPAPEQIPPTKGPEPYETQPGVLNPFSPEYPKQPNNPISTGGMEIKT